MSPLDVIVICFLNFLLELITECQFTNFSWIIFYYKAVNTKPPLPLLSACKLIRTSNQAPPSTGQKKKDVSSIKLKKEKVKHPIYFKFSFSNLKVFC